MTNLPKQNITADFSIKEFAKRSLLLLISLLFKLFAQLAVIFIYARQLSVNDYGNYQSIWLYTNVISVIGLFGLPSLLLSTSTKNITAWIEENKKIFRIIFVILNLIPLAYILLLCNQFSNSVRLLLCLIIVVQNISIVAETIAIKIEKEKIVLAANIVFNIGYLVCHIGVLHYGYFLPLLLTWLICLYCIKTLIIVFYSYRKRIHEDNFSAMPHLGKQWFYLGLNDTLGIIFKWLDKWVILLLISVTQFALYFNGSYEIPVFGLMLGAVGNIMLVELSKQGINNYTSVKTLFNSSSILLASIVFPSFAFLLFYHTEFFTFIFGNKYTGAIPIFLISIFIIPARITNYTAVLQVQHKSGLIVKGAALDLLIAIILMFVLYPVLQLRGLALAFVISTYIQAGYYLWETSKILNQKISSFFPLLKLCLLMLASIVITAITYKLYSFLHIEWNLVAGIVTTIVLIGSLLLYYMKNEHSFIKA